MFYGVVFRFFVALFQLFSCDFFGFGSAEISGLSTRIRSSVGLRNLQVGSRQSKGTQSIYNPCNMIHSLIPYCKENSCFSFCLRRPQSFQWSPGLCKYDSVERKHGNTMANSILPSIQAFRILSCLSQFSWSDIWLTRPYPCLSELTTVALIALLEFRYIA